MMHVALYLKQTLTPVIMGTERCNLREAGSNGSQRKRLCPSALRSILRQIPGRALQLVGSFQQVWRSAKTWGCLTLFGSVTLMKEMRSSITLNQIHKLPFLKKRTLVQPCTHIFWGWFTEKPCSQEGQEYPRAHLKSAASRWPGGWSSTSTWP